MSADVQGRDPEDVEAFRLRARAWIRENLPPVAPGEGLLKLRSNRSDEEELALVARERELQRTLFDGGFAGLCFPREYGGQGLTLAHQRAFNEELAGHAYPARLQVPTMSPCAAVLLEFGSEELKRQHIPAILRGDEIWMQLLSEPSGGSDVASALTSAVWDGDEWILNGSKIWTTGAWWSDWGLCLARTNWDVPKHRGLTVFVFPLRQPNVEVSRIEMLDGTREFCQEFLTDVRVPDAHRIGEVDGGWSVGVRWMFHERMMHNSPYVTFPAGGGRRSSSADVIADIARSVGKIDDPVTQDLVGEAVTLSLVAEQLQHRISRSVAIGRLNDQAAAVARLFMCVSNPRITTLGYEIAGAPGGVWADGDGAAAEVGLDYLLRQTGSIGGGTTEMARNVVSERVLGMPRERAIDRDIPFRDVPRGSGARR